MTSRLDGWTIYDNSSDYPGKFVARRFLMDQGPEPIATNDAIIADTLENIRLIVSPGRVCFFRRELDEPQIVEIWI